jgi:hypothetical protein
VRANPHVINAAAVYNRGGLREEQRQRIAAMSAAQLAVAAENQSGRHRARSEPVRPSSSQPSQLLVAANERTVRLWDIGQHLSTQQLAFGTAGEVRDVQFCPHAPTRFAATFFATAGAFAGLSLYGYTTTKSLSGFGTFLIMGLVGILIASLINVFLQSAGLAWGISFLGVLIFAGLTAYDTQKLKLMYDQVAGTDFAGKMIVLGALTLYLDFINMFTFLLQFMGDRR